MGKTKGEKCLVEQEKSHRCSALWRKEQENFPTVQEYLTRASNRYRDTMKIFYGHIESLCCFSLIYTWEWKTNCETAKREHTLCWRNGKTVHGGEEK